jgi:hypothetical protein
VNTTADTNTMITTITMMIAMITIVTITMMTTDMATVITKKNPRTCGDFLFNRKKLFKIDAVRK